MADTRDDINRERTIDRLRAQREIRPCGDYEQAARWLGDWCLCGWSEDDHKKETEQP